MLEIILWGVCPILFVLAAMSDLVSYRIPNWISLALVAAFLIAVPLSEMTLATAGWHALVGFGALLCGMLLFGFNIVGGGDAKLFAAAALWMGPRFILPYGIYFALIGGAAALMLMILRRQALPAFTARVSFLNKLMHPKAGMPYGIALGLGALFVLHDPKYIALWF